MEEILRNWKFVHEGEEIFVTGCEVDTRSGIAFVATDGEKWRCRNGACGLRVRDMDADFGCPEVRIEKQLIMPIRNCQIKRK